MAKQEYLVERLVIGNNETSKNGAVLDVGKLFGSSVLFGGSESFFRILISSLKIKAQDSIKQKYITIPIGGNISKKDWGYIMFDVPNCSTENKRDRFVKEAIIAFAKKHPGVSIIIGGPGDRVVSSESFDHHIIDYGPLAYHANNGSCIEAALVNAVSCCKSELVTNKMKTILDEDNKAYINIGQVVRLVHKLKEKLQFQKLKATEKKILNTDQWFWCTSLTRGIYILRFQGIKKRAHCIVVDGNRKLLLDSAEHYPMELCMEALLICAGKPKKKSIVKFVEIFELVDQNKTTSE